MDVFTDKQFQNATLVGNFESGSDDWHAIRATGIGGSEIGTIMGLNPWESAYTLFAKRTDRIPTLPLTSMAVQLGNALEEPILNLWAERNPDWKVYTAGTYRSNANSFMLANPDALAHNQITGEWIVIEVKTSRNYWYEVPPAYIAQVQHYLDVFDLKNAVLVGLIGMDWQEHFITRDDFQIENQRMFAEMFWTQLQADTAPAWDGSQSTYESVRAEHPLIVDEEVEIDGGHYLVEAQEKFDAAQAELLEAKSRVMSAMGAAKHAYITHEGEKFRIASRQARGLTAPYLVISKKGK
jgi:putative phage-type endonuclease